MPTLKEEERGTRERGAPTGAEDAPEPPSAPAGADGDDGASPSDALLREIARVDEIPLPAPVTDLIGARVGRFRVLALLGRGGMGVVYRVEDEALRREVALKVLPPSFAEDPERRRRFLREARAAAAVNHPNLAGIHEVGETGGRLYIAMELVPGQSLRSRLARAPLAIDECLGIARQVLRGLASAHEAGLIHRDLKPDNIMLAAGGVAKVLDFGLAKHEAPGATDSALEEAETITQLTREGRMLGTPGYMAPEQARGASGDRRSDVFSFGVVLYEMLTGSQPFRGGTTADVLTAILRDSPAPPSSLNPEVPPELDRIVERCLAKAPDDRHDDCCAVLADLDGIATAPGRDAPSAPLPGESAPRVPSAPIPGESAPRAPSAPRLPPRPRWRRATLAAGAAIALGGLLAAAVAIQRAPPAPAPPRTAITGAPAPTPVTELPPPKAQNEAALAAYREGMQGIRDSAWSVSHAAFRRAVELDPAFGAAYLRLAITGAFNAPTPSDAREAFRKVISLRSSLDERDRALLEALEPLFQRDPPDAWETRERLVAAARRYPGDAEMLDLRMTFDTDISPEGHLSLCEQCLAIDPLAADCWQWKGTSLARMGRIPEALAAWDHCLEISPAASDCLADRTMLHRSTGQCARLEEDARRQIASDPTNTSAYYQLANALHGLGRPPATVRATLDQRWSRAAEAVRARWPRIDEVRLAALAGNFEEAEAAALQWSQEIAARPEESLHRSVTTWLVLLHEETGRLKEAGKAAEEYLTGRDAWTKSLVSSVWADPSVFFLKAQLRARSISAEEYVARRAAWLRTWEGRLSDEMRGAAWLMAYASPARTAEDAREALEAQPEMKPVEYYALDFPFWEGMVGKVYLLAGRPGEALPHLQRAVAACDAVNSPIQHTVAEYHLAMAHEALGDKAAACDAYKVVLGRWSPAKRSVTAKAAAERAKALGCPRAP